MEFDKNEKQFLMLITLQQEKYGKPLICIWFALNQVEKICK